MKRHIEQDTIEPSTSEEPFHQSNGASPILSLNVQTITVLIVSLLY